jgi:hypothetical protein
MLKHCFLLLEFKFKSLNSIDLNPFQKNSNLFLPYPSPFPVTARQPLQPSSSNHRLQPAQPRAQPISRPSWPSKPPPARAATNRWVPHVIPYLESFPTRTPPPLTESVLCTTPVHGPHAEGSSRGYLSRPPPPGRPHPSRRLCLSVRRRSQTLASAAAFESPPPSLPRRREAARELHLEVSFTPASPVIVLMRRSSREVSPEFPSRAAASSGRSVASPPLSPPLVVASPLCALHAGVLRALNRAPEPEIELTGDPCRRSPPSADALRCAATRVRFWPLDYDLTRQI